MNTSLIFEKEMHRLLLSDTSETLMYVREQFSQGRYTSYMGFFDEFLYKYGIISISSIPEGSSGGYMPYVNCQDDNLFGEVKGCTDLSDKALPLSTCQKVIAHYIIDHLKRLDLSVLKEWEELQGVN